MKKTSSKSKVFTSFLILLIILGCGLNTKTEPKVVQNAKFAPSERQIDSIETSVIPKTFRDKKDKLIDSLFIDIPSEGTEVKIYKKEGNNDKIFVSNSFAVMITYDHELYHKKDSLFILKNTESFNQPLTIPGAKVTNRTVEYFICFKNELVRYIKNDTVERNLNVIEEKNREVKELINLFSIN